MWEQTIREGRWGNKGNHCGAVTFGAARPVVGPAAEGQPWLYPTSVRSDVFGGGPPLAGTPHPDVSHSETTRVPRGTYLWLRKG